MLLLNASSLTAKPTAADELTVHIELEIEACLDFRRFDVLESGDSAYAYAYS